MHRLHSHPRVLSSPGRSFAVGLATLWLGLGLSIGAAPLAWADGCYSCGGGSSEACKEYCRYTGSDTFEARKGCERKGCRVAGPAACPAAGAKICLAPSGPSRDSAAAETVAWCAAPPLRSPS